MTSVVAEVGKPAYVFMVCAAPPSHTRPGQRTRTYRPLGDASTSCRLAASSTTPMAFVTCRCAIVPAKRLAGFLAQAAAVLHDVPERSCMCTAAKRPAQGGGDGGKDVCGPGQPATLCHFNCYVPLSWQQQTNAARAAAGRSKAWLLCLRAYVCQHVCVYVCAKGQGREAQHSRPS